MAESDSDFSGSEPSHIATRKETEDALNEVLSSKAFAQSERMRSFLKYIVDTSLQSDPGALKESAVGDGAFGRPADYDPKIDPIVRVSAQRLRARLTSYYEDEGSSAPIRITLPIGGYSPAFERMPSAIVSTPPATAAVGAKHARVKPVLAFGALAAVMVAGALSWLAFRSPGAPTQSYRSIVVLPFANLTGSADLQYFSDGLTEEIIDDLTKIHGLRIISRTSSFSLHDKNADARSIAKALDVSAVLEGSVRRTGGGLRISARLIDGRSGSGVWSETIDRALQDAMLLPQDISRAVIANLKPGANQAVAAIRRPHVPSADAYLAYLKGRYQWSLSGAAGYQNAISLLDEAIKLDPEFAPSYVSLAQSYGGLAALAVVPPRVAWPVVKEMSLRVLKLDEELGEAHLALAGAMANYDWDQAGADAEYRRGLELSPGSQIAHAYYATFLASRGRMSEADQLMGQAMQIDPRWNMVVFGFGQIRYWQKRLDEARSIDERLIDRDPGFLLSYGLAADITSAQGKAEEGIALLSKAPSAIQKSPVWLGYSGYLYGRAGRTAEAMNCLDLLNAMSNASTAVAPDSIGLVYLGMGDSKRALEWMTTAVRERYLRPGRLAMDTIYDPLRGEPGFRALLKEVGY